MCKKSKTAPGSKTKTSLQLFVTEEQFVCELSNSALRLCFPQGGQHQYSEQPAVQDGAVCQQPGEPGRGTNTSLPGGEKKSRKPPLSDSAAVRDPNPSTSQKSFRVTPANRESVTSVVKWHVLVLSLS